MSQLITIYPRTTGMTDEEWKNFRSFNSKRRKQGEPEWPFEQWFAANQAKWPGRSKQPNREMPEGANQTQWNNYLAFRSFRRGKGMEIPSFEDYLEYYTDDARRAARRAAAVEKMLEKASRPQQPKAKPPESLQEKINRINNKAIEEIRLRRLHGNP